MFTKDEHEKRLKTIVETVGVENDDILNIVEELRTDYDEVLTTSPSNNGEDWEKKYSELKTKYMNRFFSNSQSSDEEKEKAKTEQEKDVKEDGKETSFDDLFKGKDE